ncbi:hypothetical protein PoB_006181400 [Plakobranchus ocellatus]|uniref:RNase H type-1 domain-containing protein n=1 Tax=Plakobranchus ocellatus TaxID=259542 RepID=A0AAV4CTV4_9GAST|nr:hypothetical protein PoB_006181400 [Plakobranchus ocellatus]
MGSADAGEALQLVKELMRVENIRVVVQWLPLHVGIAGSACMQDTHCCGSTCLGEVIDTLEEKRGRPQVGGIASLEYELMPPPFKKKPPRGRPPSQKRFDYCRKTIKCKTKGQPLVLQRVIAARKATTAVRTPTKRKQACIVEHVRGAVAGPSNTKDAADTQLAVELKGYQFAEDRMIVYKKAGLKQKMKLKKNRH